MADSGPVRRYLDNAATSWPKPPEVWAAAEHAARSIGAAPGLSLIHISEPTRPY